MSEVRVPDIGDFTDVPVIEIHVSPGDEVAVEDPLVTLESDKATMDVPAPQAGTVKQLRVKIGDRVSEGSVLLTLEVRRRRPELRCRVRVAGRGHRGVGRARARASPTSLVRRRRRARRPGRRDRLGPGRLHGRVPRRRPRA